MFLTTGISVDMFPHTDGILDMFPHTGDIHNGVSGHVEVICSMIKQKKPDAHIKIELTAEEYMKRAGEEHNRIMEEWEKNRK